MIRLLPPNESLQQPGAEKHPDESALMIVTGRRFPHIELTSRS
jgi:hypothetical protein